MLTVVLTLSSAHVAATPVASGPAPRLVTAGQDPQVATAVADVVATTPEPAADRPADPSRRAFDVLAASPRQCSLLESTTKLALLAACLRSEHCSPAVPASPPACYLVKGSFRR